MGLGDEIMVTGEAIALRRKNPAPVRIVDGWGMPRWHELWEGNPDIAVRGESGRCQVLRNGPGARPYHLGKSAERWVFNPQYRATPGRIVLSAAEQMIAEKCAGRIIIEPHIKGRASPNKQWGWMRWNKLVWLLGRAGHRLTQIGPPGTQLLDRVDFLETATFRQACAVLSRARAAVLPEGGLHHAAAAFAVPAVVIFGGFTPIEVTGYALHVNLGAALGDACGSRQPCAHCAAWMASITPEAVADELEKIIANRSERDQGMVGTVAAGA